MENCIENESYIFKLSELYDLYTKRLHDFGIHTYTHRTRLKQKIILHFKGNVQEQSDGKNAVLIFDEGMKNIINRVATEKHNPNSRTFQDFPGHFSKSRTFQDFPGPVATMN